MMDRRKSQSILEMGLFGTILISVVVILLGYLQSTNEEQYMTMNAFRKALNQAYFNCVWVDPNDPSNTVDCLCCACPPCGYNDPNTVSAGGDVVMNAVDHRRFAAGDFFGKGARTPVSGSAQIYWGVPYIWVRQEGGETKIEVENLDHFQLYRVNNYDYDVALYYDIDEDGINDWKDNDMDGDGILNSDDDDANGNGIDDDVEENNNGLFDDVDGDGISNWEDDDVNGQKSPYIEMVMGYREEYTQRQTKYENASSINNTFQADITDDVYIDFVDRDQTLTGFNPSPSSPSNCKDPNNTDDCLAESTIHNLDRQNGKYLYQENTPGVVRRRITWSHPK